MIDFQGIKQRELEKYDTDYWNSTVSRYAEGGGRFS